MDNNFERKLQERTTTKIAEHIMSRVVVLLFFGVLALGGILSFVLPHQSVSEIENRPLEKMPVFSLTALAEGKFTDGFSRYYSDNFPLREQMIATASDIMALRGVRDMDDVSLFPVVGTAEGQDGDLLDFENDGIKNGNAADGHATQGLDDNTDAADASGISTEQTTGDRGPEPLDKPALPEVPDREGWVRGAVLVVGDRALELYAFTPEPNERYATVINSFTKRYADRLKTNVLIAPSGAEFFMPPRYSTLSSSQFDSIKFSYEHLDDEINKIPAYNGIAQHIDEYLYFRTDHHWTPLGAYYAYCEFAKANGFKLHPISEYESVMHEKFLGSLYSTIGGNAEMRANPDYVLAYKPLINSYYVGFQGNDMTGAIIMHFGYEPNQIGSNKYLACAGGDVPYAKINCDNRSGRKLLVFKESYANAMLPFLVSDFEELHVVDFRYFKGSVHDLITENGITDVLFINNIQSASTLVQVNRLEALLAE